MIESFLLNAAGVFCLLSFVAIYAGSAAWAVGDARKRGRDGTGFLLLLWLLGPLAAFVWYFVRPNETLAQRTPDSYENAEDALEAATILDSRGDWEEAIAIYKHVLKWWPEHATYVENCLKAIAEKQSLA